MRLSEAMARLHCDDKIRPAYVKEVCRLLKESIIPIKKQDLELDDEQNETKNAQREINLIQGQSGVHA